MTSFADFERRRWSIINLMRTGCYREHDGQLERRCSTCEQWIPHITARFYRSGVRPLGLSSLCKPCDLARKKLAKERKRAKDE